MACRQIGFQLQHVDKTYLRLGDNGTSLLSSRLVQKELHKPLVLLRCSDASRFLWQVSADNAILECKLCSLHCCCPLVSVGTRRR